MENDGLLFAQRSLQTLKMSKAKRKVQKCKCEVRSAMRDERGLMRPFLVHKSKKQTESILE